MQKKVNEFKCKVNSIYPLFIIHYFYVFLLWFDLYSFPSQKIGQEYPKPVEFTGLILKSIQCEHSNECKLQFSHISEKLSHSLALL